MENIVIDRLTILGALLVFRLKLIVSLEYAVAESGRHVELLEHCTHITDGAKVADACEPMGTSHLGSRKVVPI